MKNVIKGMAAVAVTAISLAAGAQAWPTKPVKLLVSFPPGAPGDIVARLLQPQLQQALGQPVIVDNRPGAGGNIGALEVARATDGHTFLVGPDTMLTVNPHLYRKLAFKPIEDLVPVTYLARFNQLLACHPSAGVKSLSEFTALAKKAPFNYASGGPGVPGHLAMELLMSETGATLNHVPYRGPAPATQDLLGGVVPCGFLATPVVGPHVRAGKLVALAVSGSKRTASLPNVPTVDEAGIRGYDASFFEIVAAPKGTPGAVVDRLQQEIAKALNNPDTRASLAGADLEVLAWNPADAAKQMRADHEKWGVVNERIRLQLD
ncbi:Bug family tripartite tricarboxylate transporter substrate binding protein [Variovorax sp. RA8]|uniref:Bug family tripartite tricarboxylate transporter substrate binding protein n=1 Tax=Variovorax sp. (strain JCM 16519 / RA8) TaxID=662548 RepID=UPI001317F3C0|nr:tripartite tricarboxylate transporter substrate binding protein [Variovorax sp. RA8]VTU41628.1 Argininosuccinate lyase [Variovorax sp. RA8]